MKMSRSTRPEVFCKKVILKNFRKFSGKHLLWSLFLSELQILGPSCEFCQILFCKTLMNDCLWKPCLFELNWTIFWVPIWCCQSKIQNNILIILCNILPNRTGNDFRNENTKFYGNQVLCFPGGDLFSKFHENMSKLDKGNLKRGLTMTFKVKNL